MKKKLTYSDVLNDTIEYYSEDISRRGIDEGSCTYFDPNTGNKCAVGRYMRYPEDFSYDNVGEMDLNGLLENYTFQEIMRDEVAHLDNIDFWLKLQLFHDSAINYNLHDKKISNEGLRAIKRLKAMAKELDKTLSIKLILRSLTNIISKFLKLWKIG